MTTTTFPPHGMEQFTKSKPRRMADEVSVTPKDSISNDLLIPESMLSMAKDSRYIQQCQNLLLQVIEPIIGRYDSQSRSRLEKATWFLSCIIYTVFVIAPTGRTLGMEVCGLSFTGVTKRSRLVGSLLALATGAFAFDFISNRNTNDSAASQEALRGRDRRQIHENLRRQMLQRASSQSISSPSSTDHPSDRSQTESFQTRTFRFISKVGNLMWPCDFSFC